MFTFLHINKTGGQSVIKWFNDNNININNGHNLYTDAQLVNTHFKFTVVRNPYNRVASQFYHWRDNLNRLKKNIDINIYIKYINNESYWLISGDHRQYKKRYIQPCTQWINSIYRYNKIYKFEELYKLQKDMQTNFNFTGNIPHINKSKAQKNYFSELNDESISIINKLYDHDFLLFNYEKL